MSTPGITALSQPDLMQLIQMTSGQCVRDSQRPERLTRATSVGMGWTRGYAGKVPDFMPRALAWLAHARCG